LPLECLQISTLGYHPFFKAGPSFIHTPPTDVMVCALLETSPFTVGPVPDARSRVRAVMFRWRSPQLLRQLGKSEVSLSSMTLSPLFSVVLTPVLVPSVQVLCISGACSYRPPLPSSSPLCLCRQLISSRFLVWPFRRCMVDFGIRPRSAANF